MNGRQGSSVAVDEKKVPCFRVGQADSRLTRAETDKEVLCSIDPDVILMLRIQSDDPGAFAELVERYWNKLFDRYYRQMRDRQEAEDLTQEVFLRLYRHRKRYRPQARFSTWLFHITHNVARNAHAHVPGVALVAVWSPSSRRITVIGLHTSTHGPATVLLVPWNWRN